MPWFKVEIKREFEVEADDIEAAEQLVSAIEITFPEEANVRNVENIEIEVEPADDDLDADEDDEDE